jgi:hypothetical protein
MAETVSGPTDLHTHSMPTSASETREVPRGSEQSFRIWQVPQAHARRDRTRSSMPR